MSSTSLRTKNVTFAAVEFVWWMSMLWPGDDAGGAQVLSPQKR